ncbi:conjugal transfer protein MobC [Niabella beijingensis]|uniref:conjugal transfer protein MobC n=1 Tax=Niabella beijingensis TaxID=2872700 RepID=UPI001CBF0B2D|nr:conjugal transfer protein MobC [Niabella beijingensis]MBZ4188967.1 YWFCY domain-containing protein [Niabella beijingensis]
MSTGENEQGLRVILDFVRKGSIVILILHFYIFCYGTFEKWGLTFSILKSILLGFSGIGLFNHSIYSKLFALGLLILSLLGVKGKKDEKINVSAIIVFILSGLLLYFSSGLLFYTVLPAEPLAVCYITLTSFGFLLFLAGGARLSRLIKLNLTRDIFNEENETFPQEEQLLENKYSINLPGVYNLRGKIRQMYLNLINCFRMVLIIGSPGAGKTFYLVREIILQCIKKKYCIVLYDFKYDDLTIIAYNAWLKYKGSYPVEPKFYIINFDDPINRCNPLEPSTLLDITDATESSRTILLGLNMQWIQKTGDFFVESPINFFTAIIWFLKKYKDGLYCTLPHAIELMQANYDDLFPVLSTEPEIEVLINPFISAYMNRAMEQLEGQVASAKIALARLSSPLLYYVLSGSDFSLDVNNPKEPKIVALANNPEKTQVYGAVISLYINRLFRILPKKGRQHTAIIADEAASFFANGIQEYLSIARGYLLATFLAIQNVAQLRKSYGREQADVIFNLAGNIICGQSTGDTAKAVSESIGKIVQERESVSINRNDTSVSRNTQLDFAVPTSRIAGLSAGEFVGIVSDNPDQKIKRKAFHCTIVNDPASINAEARSYKPLPKGKVSAREIQNNYIRIKNDITEIIESEIERIRKDPELAHLLFVKPGKDSQSPPSE